MNDTTQMFFKDVMTAMQNAEEAGGPEGKEYMKLMKEIAKEAIRRRAVYSRRLRESCPPGCDHRRSDCSFSCYED